MRKRIISKLNFKILISCCLFISFTSCGSNEDRKATKTEIAEMLNSCGLGEVSIEEILNSRISARTFTNDYRDAFEIVVSNLTVKEIEKGTKLQEKKWYRVDSIPTEINSAISTIRHWLNEVQWFPQENEIRRNGFLIHPCDTYMEAVIYYNPNEKKVYYVESKM